MNQPNDAIEVDLHGLRLEEAKEKICNMIEETWLTEMDCLLFIHGFNNGVAIRNFIRNPGGLRNRLYCHYAEIVNVKIIPNDNGSTYVIFGRKIESGNQSMKTRGKHFPAPLGDQDVLYDNHITINGDGLKLHSLREFRYGDCGNFTTSN